MAKKVSTIFSTDLKGNKSFIKAIIENLNLKSSKDHWNTLKCSFGLKDSLMIYRYINNNHISIIFCNNNIFSFVKTVSIYFKSIEEYISLFDKILLYFSVNRYLKNTKKGEN